MRSATVLAVALLVLGLLAFIAPMSSTTVRSVVLLVLDLLAFAAHMRSTTFRAVALLNFSGKSTAKLKGVS